MDKLINKSIDKTIDLYIPKLNHFEDESVMIDSINTLIFDIAENAIYSTGTFRLALAGGNSGVDFYKELSKTTMDWENIEFYQTDERFVDTDNKESNQKMLKNSLAEAIDKGAEFYPIKITENVDTTAKEYSDRLDLLADNPIFDLMILGVGEDGHIASLFPQQEYLKTGTQSVIVTKTKGQKINTRISISLDTILKSQNIFVYLKGEPKYSVIEEVFSGSKKAVDYPIKLLLAHPNVNFFYSENSLN